MNDKMRLVTLMQVSRTRKGSTERATTISSNSGPASSKLCAIETPTGVSISFTTATTHRNHFNIAQG